MKISRLTPFACIAAMIPGTLSRDEVFGFEGLAASDGADHGILPAHGFAQCRDVRDVAFDDAKALVLDAGLGAIAREDRHVVARFERLGHDLTSRSAGSAEHQEFHDRRHPSTPRHLRHLGTSGTLGTLIRYHFRP